MVMGRTMVVGRIRVVGRTIVVDNIMVVGMIMVGRRRNNWGRGEASACTAIKATWCGIWAIKVWDAQGPAGGYLTVALRWGEGGDDWASQ